MPSASTYAGASSYDAQPAIRRIATADVWRALREGYDDFRANPTHLVILCFVYPVMGLILGRLASGAESLPLVQPLVAGFALIGPFAAVGLYELSRRRERGQTVSVANAFDILRSPRIGPILLLGLLLGILFVVWLFVARAIFDAVMPAESASTVSGFAHEVFATDAGWRLIGIGTAVGFLFAVVVLVIGAVSFPLLVDREAGHTAGEQLAIAVRTSVRAAAANPIPIALWGLIVAASMAIGATTLLVGFAVTMPVLGHGTWHLYRRLVV